MITVAAASGWSSSIRLWGTRCSDGGTDCASTDARVRVDTAAMQAWMACVIRAELGNRARLER
jgi:hypothetical protein